MQKTDLEKEVLESYIVVGVVVGVLVAEAAEDDELEGDQDDLEELDHELPGRLASGDELPHRIHEEEREVPTQTFVGVGLHLDVDVAVAGGVVVERRRLRNVDVPVRGPHALVQEVPGNKS